MRVLVLSRVTLPPATRGNAQYTLFFLECLRRCGHEVHVCVSEGKAVTPPVWDLLPTETEVDFFRQAVEGVRPDLLVVNYTYLACLLDLAPAGCLRAVLTHDARHQRYAAFLRKGHVYESSPWTEQDERQALARANLIVAIQDLEAAEFMRLAPHAKTLVLPCCFPRETLPEPSRPDSCLFVGSDADHNLYGMRWFLEAVWPQVLTRHPGATLDVCGSVDVRLRTTLPGVTLHGRVDDLGPFFVRNAVGIVPVLAGSGCKLKLVETLSKGRPCVSTSCGVAGLEEGTPGVIVADTAEAFGEALVRLFTSPDLRRDMGEAGASLAARRFDVEIQADALGNALAALAPCFAHHADSKNR